MYNVKIPNENQSAGVLGVGFTVTNGVFIDNYCFFTLTTLLLWTA